MYGISTTCLRIILMLIIFHVSAGEIVAHNYHRLVIDRDCALISTCSFHRVSARSKIKCAMVANGLNASGYYYASIPGACNICMTNSHATNFKDIDRDLSYFTQGKYHSLNRLMRQIFISSKTKDTPYHLWPVYRLKCITQKLGMRMMVPIVTAYCVMQWKFYFTPISNFEFENQYPGISEETWSLSWH